jgi:hypothetical protein
MPWIYYGTELPRFSSWPEEDWFTLGQISRSLAVATGGTAHEIARALLDDFKAGKFDGPWKTDWPSSEEGDDFVAFPTTELPASLEVDLRWRVRWRDEIGRERWVLVDSDSAQAGFAEARQIGRGHNPHDDEDAWLGDPSETFWLCKEAVNHWCVSHRIERLHAWPAQATSSETWATSEEILRALDAIGPSKKWKMPALMEEVKRLLNMKVSRRTLNKAAQLASSGGVIRLFGRGNPGKGG